MLIIPKCLAQNAGHDAQDCLVKMLQEYKGVDRPVGLDLTTGEAFYPAEAGIWDNYCVKKQLLNSCTVISSNLLIVDEVNTLQIADFTTTKLIQYSTFLLFFF